MTADYPTDPPKRVEVVTLSGPAGVGKSSVAFEMSRLLQRAGVAHGLIDTDELDRIYPVPTDLPRLTESNLHAVWSSFAERKISRLILVGVYLHRQDERRRIGRAVPGARLIAVRLTASASTVVRRLEQREIGSGLPDQMDKTRHQLDVMHTQSDPGVRLISTEGRSVPSVAQDALAATAWLLPTSAWY